MKNTFYKYINQLILRPPKYMTALRSLSACSGCSSSLLNLAHAGLNFACIASPVCSAKFDKPHEWNSTNGSTWQSSICTFQVIFKLNPSKVASS